MRFEINLGQGIGFCGFLGLIFIFIPLKLTGTIDWSWLWVLAPIWGPFLAIAIILTAIVITAIVIRRDCRRRRY